MKTFLKFLLFFSIFFGGTPVTQAMTSSYACEMTFERNKDQRERDCQEDKKLRRRAILIGACVGAITSLASAALVSCCPNSYSATAAAYGLNFLSPSISGTITGPGISKGMMRARTKTRESASDLRRTSETVREPVANNYDSTARYADLFASAVVGVLTGSIDGVFVKFFGLLFAAR